MRALTSHLEYEDHKIPLRKAQYKLLQVLLVGAGESADKYSFLAPACGNTDRQVVECRKEEWVEFLIAAINGGVDLDTLPDMNSCDVLDFTDMALS